MGDRKKRFAGPAAISAVAVASLVGAPSASAQVECQPGNCENPVSPAFLKLTELGFPGNTENVFLKVGKKEVAFLKLAEMGFPGNTETVFSKFIKGE